MARTKLPHLIGIEVAEISSAEDIDVPSSGSLQNSVVGRISQHERADDHLARPCKPH
jgi:hypothetical protein